MSIFHHDDQPDLTNAPPSADIRELILYRDMNQAAATNIVSMVDGVRVGDRSWGGAAVRTAIAHAKNMSDAYADLLLKIEAECKFRLAERGEVVLVKIAPKAFGRRISLAGKGA